MAHHGQLFKAFMSQSRIRPVAVYTDMGISKQAFYQLYESKQFAPETIKNIEKATRVSWEEISKVKADFNLDQKEIPEGQGSLTMESLARSIEQTAQEHNKIAEARIKEADARLIEAENMRRMIAMLEAKFEIVDNDKNLLPKVGHGGAVDIRDVSRKNKEKEKQKPDLNK